MRDIPMNPFSSRAKPWLVVLFWIPIILPVTVIGYLETEIYRITASPPARSVPELIGMLQQPEALTIAVERDLRSRGRESLLALLGALTNRSSAIRAGAARVLCKGPTGNEQAIPLLIHGLKDSSADVRAWSASALGMIHQQPEVVIPALMKSSEDQDARVRMISRLGLGEFHSLAESAVGTLCIGLEDSNELAREAAVEGLRQIQQHPEISIPALVPFLQDSNKRTRMRARAALIGFARTDTAALSALMEASVSLNAEIQAEASWALKRLQAAETKTEKAGTPRKCGGYLPSESEIDPLASFRKRTASED